jgi:sugar transferase (PEP-CTERM/EpsH1 system associated)
MRILWLKSELLHPVDKGGKIRTYQMLKRIKREHEVTYLSFASADDSAEAFEKASEYCHRLVTVPRHEPPKFGARLYRELAFSLCSPLPYAIQKYRSRAMRRAIEREVRDRDYDVVVCDFLVTSTNLPPVPDSVRVLFQHNVESMIWRRHYETQAYSIKRAFFYIQWRKMQAYERASCRSFDVVVAVSEVDRDQMRDEFGVNEVHDVPTGVDTDYFRPLGGASSPFELVFTGSMDWMPNEDAILHFVKEILPRIASSIPGVSLTIVGRNPSPALTALAVCDGRLTVTGRVDDVRPYVGRAAAYIVPIRVGGGTRLKIYEAMAMERPVISTSIGAEGLPVRDGEELLIADDPDEFAEAVLGVLGDGNLAKRLGQRAGAVVRERFGWERAAARFIEVCQNAAAAHPRRRHLLCGQDSGAGLVTAPIKEAGTTGGAYSIGV